MSTNTRQWPINRPHTGRRTGGPAEAEAREPDQDGLLNSPIFWVTVITLVILGLSGVIVWYESRQPPPPTLATPAGVTDDGGLKSGLTVGGTGPTTVEVYFDAMCADCRRMDAQAGPVLDQLVAQNRIRLIWHPLSSLDTGTDPGGYATRAANALACAADAGKLRPYGRALLANQPARGTAGRSDDELIEVAGPVGLVQPSFAACVREQRYRDWVAVGDAAATLRGVYHTPAIFVDGVRLAQPTAPAILSAVA